MFEDITSETSINQVLQKYPNSLKVFYLFNVDVCCGASQSIREAAQAKGFAATELVEALRSAADWPSGIRRGGFAS